MYMHMSPLMGNTNRSVKNLFEQARSMPQGCVLFFDEIDSLCRRRSETEDETSRRVKNEFLRQLDAPPQQQRVYVLAATNRPWELDSAVLRRFQRHVLVPLPNEADRTSLWRQLLKSEGIAIPSEEEYVWREGA